MEEVIKAYVEATKRNSMSKCEAIRAVVQQFIDVRAASSCACLSSRASPESSLNRNI